MEIHDTPQIIHQGVDTLRTAHIIKNEDNYIKYLDVLDILHDKKNEAIEKNVNYEFENGISFEFLTFGKFFIRPKGQGRYKYVIYNQDIEIFLSSVKLGANDYHTPQIVVDYRAKFLTLLGYDKAYNTVIKMLEYLLKTKENSNYDDIFKTKLMRIDLATDIDNITYLPIDKYRFQTRFKNIGHIEFKEYVAFNRLTGFSFGKGNYMFRIYDKRLEVDRNTSKLFLTAVWQNNGYDSINRPPVWRHEVQLRRAYIKEMIPRLTNDEVLYFFDKLGELWAFAFDKVTYVSLTDEQVFKIVTQSLKSDTIRQMFYRTKEKNPDKVWQLISKWQGKKYDYPQKFKEIKETNYLTAKRFLKAFLTTSYKSDNGSPMSALNIFNLVSQDLLEEQGITLHDYAQLKLLTSFIDNAQTITDYGLSVNYDYINASAKLYASLQERLMSLELESYQKQEERLARLFGTYPEDLRENINYYLTYEFEKQKHMEIEFTI